MAALVLCLSQASSAIADGGHGRNNGGVGGPSQGTSGHAGLSGGGQANGPGPGVNGPQGAESGSSAPPTPAPMSIDPSDVPDRTATAPARSPSLPETASPPAPDSRMGIDGRSGRDPDQDLARSATLRGDVVPLDRILRKAADLVPGDVLDVRLRSDRRGPWIYEIRMLSNDGRIRVVVIDGTRNNVIEVRRP